MIFELIQHAGVSLVADVLEDEDEGGLIGLKVDIHQGAVCGVADDRDVEWLR